MGQNEERNGAAPVNGGYPMNYGSAPQGVAGAGLDVLPKPDGTMPVLSNEMLAKLQGGRGVAPSGSGEFDSSQNAMQPSNYGYPYAPAGSPQGFPQGQMPQGSQFMGQSPQGQPPQGQSPQGQLPQGQPPQGQPPQGQPPQGQPPQGQLPQGQPPQGQLPQGQIPQGQQSGFPNVPSLGQQMGFPQPTPQGQQQGFPQGQPQGFPQGQQQGFPQGQPQGFPQGQPQGFPQGQPQGFPQGQPQGFPQGQPQGFPQGQQSGFPQGQPQGFPQGQQQGFPQGQPQGFPQGQQQGFPQGQPQGFSQGQQQGFPQGYPQGQPQQGYPGQPNAGTAPHAKGSKREAQGGKGGFLSSTFLGIKVWMIGIFVLLLLVILFSIVSLLNKPPVSADNEAGNTPIGSEYVVDADAVTPDDALSDMGIDGVGDDSTPSSVSDVTDMPVDTSSTVENTSTVDELQEFGLGLAVLWFENGKDMFSVGFSSATSREVETGVRILDLRYIYQNVGSDDELLIDHTNFKVFDADGVLLSHVDSAIDESQVSQPLLKGDRCAVIDSYDLVTSDTPYVIVLGYKNAGDTTPIMKFRLDIVMN